MFACLFVSVWSIQAISLKTGFQPLDVFFFFLKKANIPCLISDSLQFHRKLRFVPERKRMRG